MRRLLIATTLLALVACEDRTPTEVEPPREPTLVEAIVDGRDALGNPFFHWQPPISTDIYHPQGEFAADLYDFLSVEICEWGGDACVGEPIATFTSDGEGFDRLAMLERLKVFTAVWNTRRANVDRDKLYRLVVKAGDVELGFADIDIVRRLRQAWRVDRNEYVPVLDRLALPIVFTVEEGALRAGLYKGVGFAPPSNPQEPLVFWDDQDNAVVADLASQSSPALVVLGSDGQPSAVLFDDRGLPYIVITPELTSTFSDWILPSSSPSGTAPAAAAVGRAPTGSPSVYVESIDPQGVQVFGGTIDLDAGIAAQVRTILGLQSPETVYESIRLAGSVLATVGCAAGIGPDPAAGIGPDPRSRPVACLNVGLEVLESLVPEELPALGQTLATIRTGLNGLICVKGGEVSACIKALIGVAAGVVGSVEPQSISIVEPSPTTGTVGLVVSPSPQVVLRNASGQAPCLPTLILPPPACGPEVPWPLWWAGDGSVAESKTWSSIGIPIIRPGGRSSNTWTLGLNAGQQVLTARTTPPGSSFGLSVDFVLTASPQPPPPPGPGGLLAHYPFDDLTDVTGRNADATETGGTRSGPDRNGSNTGGWALDGNNSQIELPGTITSDLASGTINLWVRAENPTTREACGRPDLPNVSPFHCQYNVLAQEGGTSSTLRAQFGSPSPGAPLDRLYLRVNGEPLLYTLGGAVDPTQWHMYTFTWGPSGRSIYVDGLIAVNEPGSFAVSSGGRLVLGANGGATFPDRERLKGSIDELRIYNRELSQAEIAALCDVSAICNPTPPPPSAPDLLVHLPLDGDGRDISGRNGVVSLVDVSPAVDRFGQPGGALAFNGGSSMVEIADRPDLRFSDTTPFSVSYWVFGNSYGGAVAIMVPAGKYSSQANSFVWGTSLRSDGSVWSLLAKQLVLPNSELSAGTWAPGGWSHVVATYDGAAQSLYLNGSMVGSRNYDGGRPAFDDGTDALRLGNQRSFDPYWLDGRMDEFRLYGRALSPSEVARLCDVPAVCTGSARAPTVVTQPEANVTGDSFEARGLVNPNGSTTSAWFEWSTAPDLSGATSTAPADLGAGSSDVPFSSTITGLDFSTDYYYRAVGSNAGGQVSGQIEQVRTSAGLPLPDLVATGFYVRNFYPRGFDLQYSVDVSNSGGPMSAQIQFGVDVYLSTDSDITSGDILIGSLPGGADLGAGAGVTLNGTVNVPTSVAPGNYYIGVIVDPNDWVAESNDANNAIADAIVSVVSGQQ